MEYSYWFHDELAILTGMVSLNWSWEYDLMCAVEFRVVDVEFLSLTGENGDTHVRISFDTFDCVDFFHFK